MTELLDKYRDDTLTKSELSDLRADPRSLDYNYLSVAFEREWNSSSSEYGSVGGGVTERVKRRIDKSISRKRSLLSTILVAAACVTTAVLLVSTITLYVKYNNISSSLTVITTAAGERANITLPDGSRVKMNASSKISYSAKGFGHNSRDIEFNGEGYFVVAKNEKVPFTIDGGIYKVDVLGTEFNLSARSHSATTSLTLDGGKVKFVSVKRGKYVTLNPNQKVSMNHESGELTVTSMSEADKNVSSWTSGVLKFNNQLLSEVVMRVEENFGAKLLFSDQNLLNQAFTGTISATDIKEAVDVIGRSFHLKAKSFAGGYVFVKE